MTLKTTKNINMDPNDNFLIYVTGHFAGRPNYPTRLETNNKNTITTSK